MKEIKDANRILKTRKIEDVFAYKVTTNVFWKYGGYY